MTATTPTAGGLAGSLEARPAPFEGAPAGGAAELRGRLIAMRDALIEEMAAEALCGGRLALLGRIGAALAAIDCEARPAVGNDGSGTTG